MVDYSKWDRIGDDEGEEGAARARPRVTRLDGRHTVSLGPGGVNFAPAPRHAAAAPEEVASPRKRPRVAQAAPQPPRPPGRYSLDYSKWDAVGDSDDEGGDEEGSMDADEPPDGGPPEPPPQRAAQPAAAVQQGAGQPAADPAAAAAAAAALLTQNGGRVADRLLWSQTADQVTARFVVPPGTRAKAVRVSCRERHLSVHVDGAGELGGDLAYPIQEPPDGWEDLDWELTDWAADPRARRLVNVTVRKRVAPGTTAWWAHVFPGDPRVDLASIDSRSAERARRSREVWEEAHARFRENVRKRKPVVIGSDDEGGEDA
eukprot:TRINITY_DN60800_c0_g1_i1.p2 TRINITY_DN60800_c0_g1~~TRINITY_DN60800_c0_g1_i1.p2  ORF type:complete len:317 (+),score=88.07 TRINITY_DN60800_c0_g1_i1:70-1020(+)